MGSGEVTADTKSTGHYDALSHHSIIRNGLEIEATEGIVALEYHYDDNTSLRRTCPTSATVRLSVSADA